MCVYVYITSGLLINFSFHLFGTTFSFLFAELDELSLRMYVKWHYAWARRIVSPGSSQLSAAIDMSGMNEAMTADEYDAQYMQD